MKIDFGKFVKKDSTEDKIISPIDLFRVLPEKNKKYEYLRDVQNEVLNLWFEERDNYDNIIKMNTGSGKTLVGLLILKSCLNEDVGPAVYVVPDSFLIQQVVNEGKNLGIEVTTNPDDIYFKRGKSILVINIQRLINGKSIFGMREKHPNIEIGSIVIDDVHACLDTTESQFTITIDRNNNKYTEIINVFEDDMKNQNEAITFQIKDGDSNVRILIPFWAWQTKISEVKQIMHKGREDEDIMFKWPLLEDSIHLCNCVISSNKIEITPKSIPIYKIASFNNARRRIFMSATLPDDSTLVSHFGLKEDSVKKIITPKKANDIGERLILVPQAINPDISHEEIKIKLKCLSKKYNIVVIVPSNHRVEFWKDVAVQIVNKDNINECVELLKNEHVGLVVMVNRYDGVDLPDDACRVLVIDDLPNIRSEFDYIEEGILHGSERILNQSIQRIEQGMGRGVRSNVDYCAVVLMGRSLISALYTRNAIDKFSIATKAQMELSDSISEELRGCNVDDIFDTLDYLLRRDKGWVSASKSILLDIHYNNSINIDPIILTYRKSFDLAKRLDYKQAADLLIEKSNEVEDKKLKGWLLQQAAEYVNFFNRTEAQNMLKSALKYNILLTKPIHGIQYTKELEKFSGQGKQFIVNVKDMSLNENNYILKIKDLLENIKFKPKTSDKFEEAMKEIAYCIGLTGSRPERETGKGPDVIWRLGEGKFLVIECKNGATAEFISKDYCNQLNGSSIWFDNTYGTTEFSHTPIMIHPSNIFDYVCSPDSRIRIINEEKLNKFRINVDNFSKAVVSVGNFANVEKITQLLREYKLLGDQFIREYTVEFKLKNNI